MRNLILLTILAGCAPPLDRTCTVPCGVTLLSPYEDESCDAFAQAVRKDLDALEPHLPNLCGQLRDWVVRVHPERGWIANNGQGIAGSTLCESKMIVVGKPSYVPWCETGLRHELIHVGECDLGLKDPHQGWREGWQSVVIADRMVGCGR